MSSRVYAKLSFLSPTYFHPHALHIAARETIINLTQNCRGEYGAKTTEVIRLVLRNDYSRIVRNSV
jgi:hypothetical protein